MRREPLAPPPRNLHIQSFRSEHTEKLPRRPTHRRRNRIRTELAELRDDRAVVYQGFRRRGETQHRAEEGGDDQRFEGQGGGGRIIR